MQQRWKTVWSGKSADMDILHSSNLKEIYMELKRSSGFDVVVNGLSYDAFLCQYRQIVDRIMQYSEISSVYEVGCGSGANLFLLEHDGLCVGGIDYSESLLKVAKYILKSRDLVCAEALKLLDRPQYDAVISNSVFSYFSDKEYAWNVLERMYCKAKYAIGLLDIHDREKETDFLTARKKMIADYEVRYAGLSKLFYDKAFFEEFAKSHNMCIRFYESDMPGYWNNPYIFHCYMYKKGIVR